MAYNNLIKRILISLIFFLVYFLFCFINFNFIFYLLIAIYLLIITEVIINFKKFKYLIIAYILISFIASLNIQFNNDYIIKFNLMILTVIIFDMFSYFVGYNYGKIKILNKISPNKTLEGLVGGLVFSFIISLMYSAYFNLKINSYLFIFIFAIIFSSFIGDIIESFFKRLNNLKNSSELLPGHGGFFDRFDSFILSLITYSLMIRLL